MAKKLIDWLLQEDMMNLKQGLISSTDDGELDQVDANEFDLDDTQEASIAGVGASASGKNKVIFVLLLLIAAGAGAGYWYMTKKSAHAIQAPVPSVPPVPTPPPSIPATAPIAISAPEQMTEPATEPISEPVTSKISETSVVEEPETESKDEPKADAAPSSQLYGVVAGPLKSHNVPPEFAIEGYGASLTTSSIEASGRLVETARFASKSSVRAALAELDSEGLSAQETEFEQGFSLKAGPFLDSSDADKAASIFISHGLAPKAGNASATFKKSYLNLGPFEDEYSAEQMRAIVNETLSVASWTKKTK